MNDIPPKEVLDQERSEFLQQVEDILDVPVLVLGFVWLVLLIVELIWGLSPLLETLVYIIWGVFIVDFLVRLVLAPHRGKYLKQNWLTVLSLLLPALRVVRVARVVQLVRVGRAARGLRLLKVVGSLNRGMRALRASMGRRGFGYVVALTLVVTVVGAAGMFAFENGRPQGPGFDSYGDSLWWTAMLMTTLGSEAWPQTAEGRILGFALALYAFAVFGYVTATLASFFVGRDADNDTAEIAGAKSILALQQEIAALRTEIRALRVADDHNDV